MTAAILIRRCALVMTCVPLALLAGCPQDNAAAPGQASSQTTAPALQQQPTSTAAAAQGSSPVSTPANDARAQRLIDQVEATYRSGVANYRAGKLDAARMDFDLAVDTMLTSGLDLKTDPLLADEFDRLLNQVNALEMDALKQGNGLSPVLEAAPLDEAAEEVTFPSNPELTARLTADLKTTQSDFPLVVNDYVAGYISYFTNSPAGHAHLLRSLERAGKYQAMISKNLRDAGVPQDLLYLAVAESGFQPQALNAKSGAGGMWQFMPTGAYGLARNGWLDERFDPDKSSKAYAKYMKSLYNQFGDWYLAMAAYDWGPGYVQRAVMRTGYADFWELYRRNALPAETKNYVPGIIAAIIMAKNPARYGLDRMVPEPAVISDTVPVAYSIDLRLVADLTDASVQEIVALNPSLLRMRTPSDSEFDLHIPPGTKDVYAERLKAIPEEKRDSWRFHTVKVGESLEAIAGSMHSRASEIAETNGINAGDAVAAGDELVIPVASVSGSTGGTQHYVMRRGDTLVTVADRFNVSTDDLRRWNHLSSQAMKSGRSLAVTEPVRLAPSARGRGRGKHGSKRNASPETGRGAKGRGLKGVSRAAVSHTTAGSKHAARSLKTSTSASSTKKSNKPTHRHSR